MLKLTHTVEIHRQEHVKAHTHTLTHTHFPSLTHFLPDSEMDCFPTGTPTILARLFTQPSLWYLATSCSAAVHLFI